MLYKKLIFFISLLTVIPTYSMDNWQPDSEIKQAVEAWDLERLQDIVNKRPFVDPYEPERYYQFINRKSHHFYVQEGFYYIRFISSAIAFMSGVLLSELYQKNKLYPQQYKSSTTWEKIKFTTFKTLYYSCITVFGISGTIALLSNLRGGYAEYCYKKTDPIFYFLRKENSKIQHFYNNQPSAQQH